MRSTWLGSVSIVFLLLATCCNEVSDLTPQANAARDGKATTDKPDEA